MIAIIIDSLGFDFWFATLVLSFTLNLSSQSHTHTRRSLYCSRNTSWEQKTATTTRAVAMNSHTHREMAPISRYTLTRATHTLNGYNHNNSNSSTNSNCRHTRTIDQRKKKNNMHRIKAQKKETDFTHALTNFVCILWIFRSSLPIYRMWYAFFLRFACVYSFNAYDGIEERKKKMRSKNSTFVTTFWLFSYFVSDLLLFSVRFSSTKRWLWSMKLRRSFVR